jgi:cell division protein FtsB
MTTSDNLYYRKKRKRFGIAGLIRRIARDRRLMLLLILGIPLAVYILLGNRGLFRRFSLQRENAELEQKIRDARADSAGLASESKALDNDKQAIERVAREKHKMVRDGEQVYRVRPEDK